MKVSVRIAKNDAEDNAYAVLKGLEKSIEKAANLGYDGIELVIGHSKEIDWERTERIVQKHNLEISCLSTGQMFSKYYFYLTNPDPILRQQCIDNVYRLVDVAHRFGTMINLGRSLGFFSDMQTVEQTKALFIDSLSYIVDKAAQKNVVILVEPLNRYETNFINTAEECETFLQWLPQEYVGITLDLFHMNMEEALLGETFVRFKDKVKYVHMADSNKLAPGWGHINFDDVFDGLRRAEYRGWCSVEVLPKPNEDLATEQAIRFLRQYIKKEDSGSESILPERRRRL